MDFQINRWDNGEIIKIIQANNLKSAIVQAVKEKTNLYRAYLQGAYLRGAYLQGADLRSADLRSADLQDADLQGAKLDIDYLKSLRQIIPEEGSFIAWKKGLNNEIIKLLIPENAKRTCNTESRKCRAEFAQVISITNTDDVEIETCKSQYNKKFIYVKGAIVHPDKYCDDFFKDCSNGIHFFISKYEAVNY
jgi:hypothetical protein